MGNTKKKTQRLNQIEGTVLSGLIDLGKLVSTNPELFNFASLAFHQRLDLIRCDIVKYSFLLDRDLTASEKFQILSDKALRKLHKTYELTEDDLLSLNDYQYEELISQDFTKYIRKDKFLTLGKRTQANLFKKHPDWYVTEISATDHPKLTSDTLHSLARSNPAFVVNYIKDFSKLSTIADFWRLMIKFDSNYKKIFLENTKSLINKSEVRSVFWAHPTLVKLIDETMITNMKLSSKEILLLIDQIIKNNAKLFADWEVSAELKEALKFDITAELLIGTSKSSKRLTSSLNAVTKEKQEEKEDETETVE